MRASTIASAACSGAARASSSRGNDVSIFAWVISKFIQGVRHTLGTHIEGLKRRSGGVPDNEDSVDLQGNCVEVEGVAAGELDY